MSAPLVFPARPATSDESVEPAKPDAAQAVAAPVPVGRGAFTTTDSPCVAVCSTLYDDVCRGCGRTAMEVANWVFLDEGEKQVVWQRIRAQGYPRRKG